MGIEHSKNQYSFSDHYYVIQDSFPTGSYYCLQSKLTDELFIGRQINCTDKQQAYQTQCIINQKLRNPSPFVTKLLSAQKNAQNGYCETNHKFHILFREVSKLLSQQIQQRKIRSIPFTAQEIIMIIIRIAKGLKYIYQIGHHHGNISSKAITWPTQNFQSIQLIDQWSLRDTNKFYNNTLSNQNNNKHADDLHSLGLVAKSMMQISPPLNKQQNIQIIQSLKHKIFILLSQNPLDRLQIYNVFSHMDRQLENQHILTNNNLDKINNQVKVNLYNGNPNYPTNQNNHYDLYRNKNINGANINQNNQKILVGSVSVPIQVTKNNQINFQQVNNTNQNIHHNQISTVVKNNVNNTKYVQPPYPTISNIPKPAFNNKGTITSNNPIYYPNSNTNIKIAQPSNIANNYPLNGLVRNTTSQFYQQKYTSVLALPKIPVSSINNSSIKDTHSPYQNNTTNTSNVLTSFVNNFNYTPNFGHTNVTSSLNNANPIFSFNDSIMISHAEQKNLLTSPDFFAKIHNSYQNKFNIIKIEDHHSEHNNVKNQQIQPISLQPKNTGNNLLQQNSVQVNSSIINNFIPVEVNQQIKHNKQLSPSPAVNTSQQIHSSTTTNLNKKQPQNQTTNTQNNTNYDNSISSRQLQNQNVTVIPQLNEQSDNEEQQRQYVVQEFDNGSRYEGQKLDGMRDGNGKFYYKEGSYYEGRWKKNNMHGFGRLFYPNHKLAYEGDWFIDQFHGNGKVYNDEPSSINGCFDYTNFDKIQQKWKYYEGTLVCDSKQGFGKLLLANNQYYEGNFLNDRVHGQGRFVNLYGEVVHGIWDDSKLVKILAN